MTVKDDGTVRSFDTGATRDTATNKFEFDGFLSPRVLLLFANYMHKHRHQSDGTLRDSDNWQKGIPNDVCFSSLLRHVMDVWVVLQGDPHMAREPIIDALCAIIFNAQAILLNLTKEPEGYEHLVKVVDFQLGHSEVQP